MHANRIKKLSRRGKKNKSKREETDSPTASEGNDEVINEISFEDERVSDFMNV